MSTVSVYNMEGAVVGDVELSDAVFGVEINEHLVHQAVIASPSSFKVRIKAARSSDR